MKIILIGGVGGSGTRVVARVLKNHGMFIGCNLNDSLDNLDWPGQKSVIKDKTLTFDQKLKTLQLPFQNFIENMVCAQESDTDFQEPVLAIKVPGSFFYLPYLCSMFDDFTYIHVIRHGLDMAFSNNKNQLRNWGELFDLCGDQESNQLGYWLKANEYAIEVGSRLLEDKFLLIRFEDLCDNTEIEVNRLFDFLQIDTKIDSSVFEFIKRPKSFQHYRQKDISIFDSDDLLSLKKFGYEVRS